MIIIAHLCLFAVLYAFGLPLMNSQLGAGVSFGGGLIALALMCVASEAAVIAAAIIGRSIAIALKINPLLERGKAAAISHVAVGLFLLAFLCVASYIFPDVVSVPPLWAVPVSGLVVGILEVMVRVKRHLIARSYR